MKSFLLVIALAAAFHAQGQVVQNPPAGGSGAVAPAGYGYLFPASNWAADFSGSLNINQALNVVQINVPVGLTVTKAHISISVASAATTVYVGIYNGTCSTLLSSGSGASTATGLVNVTMSSVALSAGTYYMAFADSASAAVALNAMGYGTVGSSGYNQGTHPMFATAANAVSGGVLPASCGTLTAASGVGMNYPYVIFDN